MKLKNTPLTALICASLIGSAALSQGAVLWADNFNDKSGGFAHQGGGTGLWPGNWFSPNGTIQVTTGVVNGDGNMKRDLGTTFASNVGPTGTIWLSFDWGQNTAAVNYGGLTFFTGAGVEKVLIGNTYGGETTWNMNGATPTGTTTGGMHTGVARITLAAGSNDDIIELWVGATGSPVDVGGAAMATATRDLSDISLIRIMGGDAQTFDNLVIGTTMFDVAAIPEPDAALLGGLGMLALLRRRR